MEDLCDVVIYPYHSRVIEAIVGERMPLLDGFYNAEKRRNTALSRINDHYGVAIILTGRYTLGDVLPPEAEVSIEDVAL